MAKFRSREVVSAVQFQPGRGISGVLEDRSALAGTVYRLISDNVDHIVMPIPIQPGDWIVADQDGYRSIVKERDFLTLYEPLEHAAC